MKKFKKIVRAAIGAVLTVSLLSGTALTAAAVAGAPEEDLPLLLAETAEGEAGETPTTSNEMAAYLFVHFIDTEETADKEQVYFSVSQNGTRWKTLNGRTPVLRSTEGEEGVRDPNIIRKQDGTGFYLIATDLSIYNLGKRVEKPWTVCQEAGSHSIVVWESADLVNWTYKGLKEIARSNAGCTWAPEAIYDEEKEAYMVHWASRTKEDGKQRVYRCYTTDFDTFTEPELYIEAEDSRIDCTFIKEGDTYYRFTKDEHNTYVYMEKCNSLSGDFQAVNTYTINGASHTTYTGYEGPTIYKLNDKEEWCLLLDNWTYKPFITDNLAKGRFTSASEFSFGGARYRHGTVIPITQAEYDALVEAYPFVPNDVEETTETGELIYALDFEGEEPLTATTGTQVATAKGTIEYVDGIGSGKAAKINGSGNYISIDGSMLSGKTSFTVSFAVQIYGSSWMFYAAPNEDEQKGSHEKYIGAGADLSGAVNEILCERYNNNGSRPASLTVGYTKGDWVHITLVYREGTVRIYVNGILEGKIESSVNLAEMLGDTPVLQLGKANWTANGEYSNMVLDCFKIHDYALSGAEVMSLYEGDLGIAKE